MNWVAKSCTTSEYRWLFRDSPPSLTTLWSAVIRSRNVLARGTAFPVRLLQGALVILVRLQTLQFRSLGKWVWIMCFLDATFVGRSESESGEMFADAGTSASSRLSVNSPKHSGRSRKRLPAAPLWSSSTFLLSVLGGSRLVGKYRHVVNLLDPKTYLVSPAGTMQRTNLSWYLATIPRPQ